MSADVSGHPDGEHQETVVAREQTFAAGTILVFDRGYLDFAWLAQLTAAGVFFITRLKSHAAYRILKRRPCPQNRGVVADHEVRFTGPLTRKKYRTPCGASSSRPTRAIVSSA